MEKMNKKTITISILIILFTLLSNFTVVSCPMEQTKTEEQLTITVTDLLSQTQSKHILSKTTFFELFNQDDSNENIMMLYQQKLNILLNNDILSPETTAYLKNNLAKTENKISTNDIQSQGALFDVVNLFNGVFFALKGEKTASFLELPVYQFPFFENNITALFSGFSKYSGNGFIFTLGTLGFQYAYDYDPDSYDFPYFPSVSGSIIGFTGVLMEADVGDIFGPQYEGFYSIGIGMNIFTLWDLK
jgi:hypothetical protein